MPRSIPWQHDSTWLREMALSLRTQIKLYKQNKNLLPSWSIVRDRSKRWRTVKSPPQNNQKYHFTPPLWYLLHATPTLSSREENLRTLCQLHYTNDARQARRSWRTNVPAQDYSQDNRSGIAELAAPRARDHGLSGFLVREAGAFDMG